jgi:hypothetical protein
MAAFFKTVGQNTLQKMFVKETFLLMLFYSADIAIVILCKVANTVLQKSIKEL